MTDDHIAEEAAAAVQRGADDDYWATRRAPIRAEALRRRLKRITWVNAAVSTIMSTRRGSDTFLLQTIKEFGLRSVLDVACGEGNAALAAGCRTSGADIDGAPLGRARRLGYERTFTYRAPQYDIGLSEEVDAVTAIAVNAHVPFQTLQSILAAGARKLRPGGVIVIVAECDNEGLSYKMLRRVNRPGFDSLVNSMGHYFLESESSFLRKLLAAMPDFDLHSRQAIVGSFVPYFQYRHALTLRDAATRTEQAAAFGFDALFGMVNRAQLAFSDAVGASFLVGIILHKRPEHEQI